MGDTSPNSQLLMRRIAALEARLETQDQMADAAAQSEETISREQIVQNIFAGTRSVNWQAKVSPFKPYPKWIYTHATAKELAVGCPFRQAEVFNAQEEAALKGRGDWWDTPADVPLPAGWGDAPVLPPIANLSEVAAPATHQEVNPAAAAVRHRGRPRKPKAPDGEGA